MPDQDTSSDDSDLQERLPSPPEIDLSEISSQLEIISEQLTRNMVAILETEPKNSLAFREGAKGIEKAIDDASVFPLTTVLLVALLGSLLSAAAAYAFNYFHWRQTKKVEKREDLTRAIIQTVERFESFAIDYWLQSYNFSKTQELETLEINIKSTLASIRSHSNVFKDVTEDKRAPTTRKSLGKFGDEVYDIATGGNFESTSRIASKATATKISTLCENLKIDLLSQLFN